MKGDKSKVIVVVSVLFFKFFGGNFIVKFGFSYVIGEENVDEYIKNIVYFIVYIIGGLIFMGILLLVIGKISC